MLHHLVNQDLLAAGLDPAGVEQVVQTALDEDLRYGPDVTSPPPHRPGRRRWRRWWWPGSPACWPACRWPGPCSTGPACRRSRSRRAVPTGTGSAPGPRCCASRPRCASCWARSGRC